MSMDGIRVHSLTERRHCPENWEFADGRELGTFRQRVGQKQNEEAKVGVREGVEGRRGGVRSNTLPKRYCPSPGGGPQAIHRTKEFIPLPLRFSLYKTIHQHPLCISFLELPRKTFPHLVAFNRRDVLSPSSGGWKSEIKVLAEPRTLPRL